MKPIKQTESGIPSVHGDHVVRAVLIKDDLGSYAVYLMICPKGEAVSALHIANNGMKASYREALIYFPTLAESEYRK